MTRFHLLIIAALIGISSSALALPVTYTLNPFIGSGSASTLNGSITVDDADSNNLVAAAEIRAWSFTADLVPIFLIQSQDTGASATCMNASYCFSIRNKSLLFDFGAAKSMEFVVPTNLTSVALAGAGCLVCLGTVIWATATSQDFFLDTTKGLTEVAVAQSTPIPEPSTLVLVAIALAAGFGVARTRAGKLQSVPA